MATPGTAFSPVSLTQSQVTKFESMMKQQVQDAILARSAQLAKDNALDSNWKLVGSLCRLKTFKLNGIDSFNTTSSWATTLRKKTRATSDNVNERISVGGNHQFMRSRSNPYSPFGRLSLPRHTVGGTIGRHDSLNPHPQLQSFRTFGRVQGNYRDIVDVHHASNSFDFLHQQKLLSPIVTNAAVLRTVRATKDSYLGIKWLAENSFAGKRDYCFLEMVGYTINTNGQEIGFVALASVDVPECPDLSDIMKMTRVRMKRTMLVIPTTDTLKVMSEIFEMGSSEAYESSIVANAQYRLNMAILNEVSLAIDSQNIAKQTLAPQKNWVLDESRLTCTICSRRFHFMYRRRHHCRLCGDVVCKTCYVTRSVPGAEMQEAYGCEPADPFTICQTKFCVRCVMGLRAIDKRLSRFSEKISKMLSLHMSDLNVSETEVVEDNQYFTSHQRNASITYFKRGTNKKHKHNNSGQIFDIPVSTAQTEFATNTHATVAVGGTGVYAAYEEADHWGSVRRPSLSLDPSHSNSYSKLQRLSQLSRHSSTPSLTDSQCDPDEEKVLLSFDIVNRIVVL